MNRERGIYDIPPVPDLPIAVQRKAARQVMIHCDSLEERIDCLALLGIDAEALPRLSDREPRNIRRCVSCGTWTIGDICPACREQAK